MPTIQPPHSRKQYASFSAAMPLRTPLPLEDAVVDGWGMEAAPFDQPKNLRIDGWASPRRVDVSQKKTVADRDQGQVFIRRVEKWASNQRKIVNRRAGEAGEVLQKAKQEVEGEVMKAWRSLQEDTRGGLKTAKHIFAGAAASVVARSSVAPLERLKLEYMVCGAKAKVPALTRRIFAREGMMGFWRGNGVNLLRIVPFKTINFVAYDLFRQKILDLSKKEDISNGERLAAGAVAGVIATVVCFPLDTVRTRMIARGGVACTDLTGCLVEIIRKDGFLSLYRGLWPALYSIAPSCAIFYAAYDFLKTSHLQSLDLPKTPAILKALPILPVPKLPLSTSASTPASRPAVPGTQAPGAASTAEIETVAPQEVARVRRELGPMRTLVFGAVAGVVSELATYPLEVVRRQMQMSGVEGSMAVVGKQAGAMRVLKEVMQRGGIPALYAGCLPGLLQVLPSAALSYWVYDFLKLHLKVE